jgi:hypothetical protein
MSLLGLLFNRSIKISPVYPIYDNDDTTEPVNLHTDTDTDTDTVCSTEYDVADTLELNSRSFDPDLEPGDYYLQKIRRNMEVEEEKCDDDEIINIDDVEPDIPVERLYYIYNQRFANIRFIDSLV